jgi:hypothetical protein
MFKDMSEGEAREVIKEAEQSKKGGRKRPHLRTRETYK